jgi:3-methyladenine DNA glycosylase AlkD
MTASTVAAVLSQIEAALRPLADAQQAVHMRAYILGKFAFLGIRATPRRQALCNLPRLKAWSAAELLALAEALWDLPEREFQYVAVDLLAKHHRQLELGSLPRLLQLVQRHSWWDTVDGLAGVVGDILLRARTVECDVQRTMDACLSHSNLWVRRVAMLHQLGWKAQTDEARLLHYALRAIGKIRAKPATRAQCTQQDAKSSSVELFLRLNPNGTASSSDSAVHFRPKAKAY